MGESHMKLRLMNAFTSLTIAAMLVGCGDRKSTRLNSSHSQISYAVFCLQKKRSGAVYFILMAPAATHLGVSIAHLPVRSPALPPIANATAYPPPPRARHRRPLSLHPHAP